jgi:nucleoside-diphosphate-sugar epimerase
MRRVLITGAAGFLGRNCLPLLADWAAADAVHAVVRPGSPSVRHGCVSREGRDPNTADTAVAHAVRVHQADLLDPAAVTALAAEVRATHLLHLAWVATPGDYWTSPLNRVWAGASLHLLRAFVEHGGRRAVLAGSCAEYDWAAGWCREGHTPLRPGSLYGECKKCLHQAAEEFALRSGLSLAWARLFFLYGSHEHPSRLAPSVIRALLQGRPAACSVGGQRRDYLHAADAAGALVALLQGGVCGAVNVGSGIAVPVGDLVRRLAELCGRPDAVRVTACAADAAPLVAADVNRLRNEVGWKPRLGLEEGLAQTVAWWRWRLCEKPQPAPGDPAACASLSSRLAEVPGHRPWVYRA